MPQETPERLLLACVVAVNDQSGVISFISNQGFAPAPAGVQIVADGGLGIAIASVLIYRPEEFPATPGNMIALPVALLGPSVVPAAPLNYQIAGPGGLGAPFNAAVQAASQAGDIGVAIPALAGPGDGQFSLMVFQIAPAD